jgi:galactose oxidase
MLLPDATVLNGGGGLCGNCSANHYDAEIFTPPYLFTADGQRATRPEIINVINGGARAAVGKVLRFQTDSEIKSASLVRVGTTTHTVNTDQRRVPLDLKPLPQNKYAARLPDDAGIILPGWYMLFAMNSEGTPSEAKMVKVELPSGPTYESNKYGEEEEALAPAYPGVAHDCDDGGEEVQGIISFIFTSSSNFWKTWKTALVTQV